MIVDKGLHGPVNSLIGVGGKDLLLNNENNGKINNPLGIQVVRKTPVNQTAFHDVYQLTRPKNKGLLGKVAHAAKSRCASCANSDQFLWRQVKNRLPVLKWLPKYDFRKNFVSDLAGGLTVGVLHIPQGMAYSLLANVPPVVGLYVSFFPVLIYFLMGTSLHLSVGSSTVVSLMVGKIITDRVNAFSETGVMPSSSSFMSWAGSGDASGNGSGTHNITSSDVDAFKIQVAVTACFLVGLFQCAMGLLQLGTLSVYLSDMLISGFTTGAAVQSLTSQLKELFGVAVPKRGGPLNLLYTYFDVFSNITNANVPTCIVSAVTIICLVLVNEGINAQFRNKMKIPIPIELIVIVVGTIVSYFYKFSDEYDVKIVNTIPTGIPMPKLPQLSMMRELLTETFAIAVVVFSLSVSISKLLAKKHKYEINPTQELLAYGVANVVGAFFSCFPCCASISRSLVQEVAGGKSQLSSLASCVLMLIVLLVIAPLFATLPNSVLAAIIVVALKGMFKQFLDFKRAWKVSKLDAATWAVTFLSVVLVDIDIGLGVGLVFSLITVLLRTKRPKTLVMGNVPYTDVYLDIKKFKAAKEIDGIKVLHFSGALYFANKDHFRNDIYKKTFNPQTLIANQKKVLNKQEKERLVQTRRAKQLAKNAEKREETGVTLNNNLYLANKNENDPKLASIVQMLREVGANVKVHTIILDCSAISFIDAAGLASLYQLLQSYEEISVKLFLADCQDNVTEKLELSEFYAAAKSNIFPTVHDAVLFALYGNEPTTPGAGSGTKEASSAPASLATTFGLSDDDDDDLPIKTVSGSGPSTAVTMADGNEDNEDSLHAAYVNMSFVEHL